MRKLLMASVMLPLVFGQAASLKAQSAIPTYQDSNTPARRQAVGGQATAELFYMIQQLQEDVRRLQGQVEEQQHLITRLQAQGRDRYVDLDQRILDLSEKISAMTQPQATSALAGGAGASGGGAVATRTYRAPDAQEQEDYDAIIDLIRKRKAYDQAISSLYEFIEKYPEGDLTVNAYYWLGEVYLAKPQLEQARQAFTIVATRYADHRKAPDALYKLGMTVDRMGEHDNARQYMERVIRDYPDSSAAGLARRFLEAANG